MFSLYYRPENKISIDGKEYTVNTSFDVILRLIDLLKDHSVSDSVKLDMSLKMLLGDAAKTLEYNLITKKEIFNQLFDKFVMETYKKPKQYDRQGNEMPLFEEDKKSHYSLKYDASYIYSSFMQAYQIDLIEQQGRLDWLKFQALLSGLPEGTKFREILSIRTWKPQSKSDNEKQRMRELQEVYRLPDEEEVE